MGLTARRRPTSDEDRRDEGTAFILILVLTVVTSMVVLALANYAAAGLATSRATDARTNSTGDAQAAVAFVAEQMAMGEAPCDAVAPPPAYVPNESTVGVTCEQIETVPGGADQPVVRVRVQAGTVWTVAYLQVVPYVVDSATGRHPVVVYSWSDGT